MVTHVEVRHYTVWKIQDFSVTHILREINLENLEVLKTAIFTISKALNIDFYD